MNFFTFNRLLVLNKLKWLRNTYKVSSNGIEEVKSLGLDVDHAEWSPNKGYLVIASFRSRMSNRLYFIDTSDMSVMADGEHHMMSSISWDPTSRYVVSCAYAGSMTTDAGYVIWSFQGKKLSSIRSMDLSQFMWRPRHPSLITDAKVKDIRRNFKQYCAKFKELDEILASKLSAEQVSLKRRLTEEFSHVRRIANERLQKQAQGRQALRREFGVKKPNKYEEELFDFLLSIDEETLKS